MIEMISLLCVHVLFMFISRQDIRHFLYTQTSHHSFQSAALTEKIQCGALFGAILMLSFLFHDTEYYGIDLNELTMH